MHLTGMCTQVTCAPSCRAGLLSCQHSTSVQHNSFGTIQIRHRLIRAFDSLVCQSLVKVDSLQLREPCCHNGEKQGAPYEVTEGNFQAPPAQQARRVVQAFYLRYRHMLTCTRSKSNERVCVMASQHCLSCATVIRRQHAPDRYMLPDQWWTAA